MSQASGPAAFLPPGSVNSTPAHQLAIAGQFAGQLANSQAAAKTAAEKIRRKPSGPIKRKEDEVILSPTAVEGKEALSSLAENTQEDAHEDRQQHEQSQDPRAAPPSLDISG